VLLKTNLAYHTSTDHGLPHAVGFSLWVGTP